MVILILIVGINNLLLGYAAAVWLGYGPPSGAGVDLILRLWPVNAAPWPAARMPEPIAPLVPKRRAERTAELKAPATSPAASDAAPPPIEMLVYDLNRAVLNSTAKLTDIDTRLRTVQGQADLATVGQSVADLLADCESYLSEQSQATERFHGRAGELGPLGALAEQIEIANLELSAQIETSISHLRQMSLQSDPAVTADRLLTEIHELRVARHRLRDQQDQAFLAVVRQEDQWAALDTLLKTDALTGLPNRVGLEECLEQWWQQRASQSPVVAMVDLDEFGNLNKMYGPRAGDRILSHVGECLRKSGGEAALVGRYAGKRFIAAARDVSAAAWAASLQHCRQSIERTTFHSQSQTVRPTLSAVVAAPGSEESLADFLKRLDLTLAEARTRGPNQVSLSVDGRIEAVGPVDSGTDQQTVEL